MTTINVYDGEPSKAKPDWPSDEIAIVVGTTVRNAAGHPLDVLARDGSSTAEVVLSTDSTHMIDQLSSVD